MGLKREKIEEGLIRKIERSGLKKDCKRRLRKIDKKLKMIVENPKKSIISIHLIILQSKLKSTISINRK